MCQCVREVVVRDGYAQYTRQLKLTQCKPVGRQRVQIVYVGTALKIERAQGHQGEDQAQGQKDNAVKQ